MRAMTEAERALAEQAMSIVSVVINSMGRSFPGIKKKLCKIDAKSVAYMAVCRAAQTYNAEKSQVTTYFSSAIRNALLKELAKTQRLRYDSPERVSLEAAERMAVPQSSRSSSLPAALEVLPTRARRLIVCRYYTGMSVKEMASLFNCNQKALRSELRQALSLMKELLGSQPSQPGTPGAPCSDSIRVRSGA